MWMQHTKQSATGAVCQRSLCVSMILSQSQISSKVFPIHKPGYQGHGDANMLPISACPQRNVSVKALCTSHCHAGRAFIGVYHTTKDRSGTPATTYSTLQAVKRRLNCRCSTQNPNPPAAPRCHCFCSIHKSMLLEHSLSVCLLLLLWLSPAASGLLLQLPCFAYLAPMIPVAVPRVAADATVAVFRCLLCASLNCGRVLFHLTVCKTF